MLWYKKDTGLRNHPDISDVRDEFGDAGYAMYNMIMEIYGEHFARRSHDGKLSLSVKYLERELRRKFKKIHPVLVFFQNRSRIYFEVCDKTISIYIPNYIDISSNWTKRQNALPTEVPTAKEAEVELEAEAEREADLKADHSLLYIPQIIIPEHGLSVADIKESSPGRINGYLNAMAIVLSKEHFPEAKEYIKSRRDQRMNPRAILHALNRYLKREPKPKHPSAYCDEILTAENGNYNEQDSINNHS